MHNVRLFLAIKAGKHDCFAQQLERVHAPPIGFERNHTNSILLNFRAMAGYACNEHHFVSPPHGLNGQGETMRHEVPILSD
jgi:hypothetical protein